MPLCKHILIILKPMIQPDPRMSNALMGLCSLEQSLCLYTWNPVVFIDVEYKIAMLSREDRWNSHLFYFHALCLQICMV